MSCTLITMIVIFMHQILYVPPPDTEGRYEILQIHTRRMMLGEDVDLMRVAECTDLFTGAELGNLCNEAGMAAFREIFGNETGFTALRKDMSSVIVFDRHFQAARDSLRPLLTKTKIEEYSLAKFRR